mmetsp:Transcript_126109/g.218535  ORF Transcript_126109/g.218535 Transcript_126109/m.218535 type:complete len:226 (+) Transcript_126109:98-775(+)
MNALRLLALWSAASVSRTDATVCTTAQVAPLIAEMSSSCNTSMVNALANGVSLNASVRCPCYMQIPRAQATALTCKAQASDSATVSSAWNTCDQDMVNKPVCQSSDLNPLVAAMSSSCQTTMNNAMQSNTQLTGEQRCPCYLQIPKNSALSVDCRGNSGDSSTITSEYVKCAGNASYATPAPTPPAPAPPVTATTSDAQMMGMAPATFALVLFATFLSHRRAAAN